MTSTRCGGKFTAGSLGRELLHDEAVRDVARACRSGAVAYGGGGGRCSVVLTSGARMTILAMTAT